MSQYVHVTSLLAAEHSEFLCWWLPETKVRTLCSYSLAFNSRQPISSQPSEDLWRDSQCEILLPSCYPIAFEAELLTLAVPMAAAGCWLLSYQSVWFKGWVWKPEALDHLFPLSHFLWGRKISSDVWMNIWIREKLLG